MAKHMISNVGAQPMIEVKGATGDVRVEGWERPDLEAGGDNLQVERGADAITISGAGDIEVFMPEAGGLRISSLVGDLSLKNLTGNVDMAGLVGELRVTNVTGSLSMRGATVSASGQGAPTRGANEDGNRLHAAHAQGIEGAVSQAVKRAMEGRRRAEEKIHAADRKLQRVLGKRASVAAGWRVRGAAPERDMDQTSEPATEAERLAILKMVQSKKITAAQADLLLRALEGQKAETTDASPQGADDGRT